MKYDPRRGLYLPDSIPPKPQGFPPHLDIPDDIKGPTHIAQTSKDHGTIHATADLIRPRAKLDHARPNPERSRG